MKSTVMLLATSIAFCGMASAKSTVSENSAKTKGTVQNFILNPEGEVDGLILKDGEQISFPPHMSARLTAAVAPNDSVEIEGFRENKKVFHAEKITNVKSAKSVVEVPPGDGPREMGEAPPPPPPPPGPGAPPPPPGARRDLHQMSAQGKIEAQIFGRRGEVNGVVLSDHTIVRIGPRMQEDTSLKTGIGQNLKASGFGTENGFGKAFEATEISNN